MRVLRIILVILSFVLVGCSTSPATLSLIERSEQLAIDHPDSALNIIRSVDPSTIYGRDDRARYTLALCEAYYYNHQDAACDSLVQQLFDHYLTSDRHHERARALFQYGFSKMCSKDISSTEPLFALLEAERSLQYVDNPRLLGLVYSAKADIYNYEFLLTNALELYQQSCEVFQDLGMQDHIAWTKYCIGGVYQRLGDYAKAEEQLLQALECSIEENYSATVYAANELCSMYVRLSRYDDLERCLSIIRQYGIDEFVFEQYHCNMAILESHNGNRSEALRYLDVLDSITLGRHIEIEYVKSIVYKNLGDIDTAFYWLELNKMQQEDLMRESLSVPILNYELDMLRQNYQLALIKNRNLQLFYFALSLVFVVMIVTIIIVVRYRILRQKHEIDQYISALNELRFSKLQSSSNSVAEDAWAIYSSSFGEINALLETYYVHGDTIRESSKIVEQVKSTVETMKKDGERFAKLEQLVNLYHNNILAEIRAKCTKLNDKEIRCITYLLSGFSARSICLMLDIDGAALSRLKYKVKTKLTESGLIDISDQIFSKR